MPRSSPGQSSQCAAVSPEVGSTRTCAGRGTPGQQNSLSFDSLREKRLELFTLRGFHKSKLEFFESHFETPSIFRGNLESGKSISCC